MTRIDIHHHLVEEVGYIDQLLGAMDEFEIERCSLIGMGPICHGLFVRGQHDGSTADNDAVATIVKQHPDRFFGLGFIRLGVDAATRVDELRDRGFAALKFHVSRNRYDAEENFPVFEKAQAHGLPCLFHTGIINLPEPMPGERISSFNMDAIHLEAIAQEFPDLKIIIAHLGVQANATALTLIRLFPNIYADLSGGIPGWRGRYDARDWPKMFFWPEAHKKVVFGSDVHCAEYAAAIDLQQGIFDAVGWDAQQQANVYRDNATRLFGFSAD